MLNKSKLANFNIIMINLDGLRRDKIPLCDSLLSLIKESYFFNQMNTVAPYTFASIHAIMSGMYPSSNGVDGYYNMFKFKNNEIITLAEALKNSDYFTYCDINSKAIIPKKGFDKYEIYDEQIIDFTHRHCEIIKKLSKKKFFLFLQNTETHNNLVREIIKNDKDNLTNNDYFNSLKENDLRYNSHLPKTNFYVKSIVQALKNLNLYDKTILIIFSDHGTSIGEKTGEKFYGVFLYDYTLNVFTILHIPNHDPVTINKQCRTIDLFPTILEIVNSKNPLQNNIQGESLIPLIKEDSKDREVFAETGGLYGPWPSPEKHNVFCIKYNQKKLIYNASPSTWEFYDLKKDPKELNNIFSEKSIEIQSYKKKLLFYLEKNNIHTKIS